MGTVVGVRAPERPARTSRKENRVGCGVSVSICLCCKYNRFSKLLAEIKFSSVG